MKKYEVTIIETLQRTVFVEAESALEAEEIVKGKIAREEIVLDADDFIDRDYSITMMGE